MSLWTELKRRNVFRVAAAYAVVAWLLVEISDTIFPHLLLPSWAVTLVIVLLILGFPVALVLSWAYEITSEGLKRTEEVQPAESISRLTGRNLDFIVIGMLALALGWFVWDKFGAGFNQPKAPVAAVASIAVLPFADMSPGKDQEYFSDGLSEEVLNLLAQIKALKVIGRTSSFAFKGRNVDLREIGTTLGVAYLLEGSVRRAGDDLRITAQLVRADDGSHIWSERYDRKLENVFAIQSEIAGAIAEALKLNLAGGADAAPAVHATGSLPAYERYLQARRLIQGRTREGLEAARTLLEAALELDPDYAPAHADAAKAVLLLTVSIGGWGDIPFEQAVAAAQPHLDRALALDPQLAEAHAVTGLLHQATRELDRSNEALARALALNPSLSDALNWRALNLLTAGRLREAVETQRRTAELDPLNLSNLGNLAWSLFVSGQTDAALEVARRLRQGFPDSPSGFGVEANALRSQGRLAEAHAAAVQARAMAPRSRNVEELSGWVYYALGDFEQLLDLPGSSFYGPALVALGRADEAIAQTRERAAAEPTDVNAAWGFLATLSLAGRPAELLDDYRGRWGSPAALAGYFGYDPMLTAEMAPIAAAQRALGRTEALAETLRHWGKRLAFMREQGFASGYFVIEEAHHRALAGEREAALGRLTGAIDLGYRDPRLAYHPAFAPFANDPDFQALVSRMTELINAERAKLGMEALT